MRTQYRMGSDYRWYMMESYENERGETINRYFMNQYLVDDCEEGFYMSCTEQEYLNN